MPVVALTGATGFVGGRLLARLCAGDHRVRALARRPPSEIPGCDPDWIRGELNDPDALAELVRGVDAVIHLAGAIGGRHAADFLAANTGGTRALADAVEAHAPDAHFILMSSLAAREPHLSWYAVSKLRAEEALRVRVRRWTVLRPPAIYGPTDPALAPFWRLLARGWLVRLGPADARFSLVHVDDAAEACERLLAAGPASTVLTLEDGREDGWSWPALAELAAERRGRGVRTVAVPPAVLGTAARLNLALGRLRGARPVLNPGKVRELVHPDWVCDTVALARHLGWRPERRLDSSLDTLPGWNTR